MKYLIKLSLIAVAIVSLTGCGQKEEITQQNQNQNQSQQATQSTDNTVNNNDQNLDQDQTSTEVARKNLGQDLENLATDVKSEQTPSLASLSDKPDLTTAGRKQPLMLQESVIDDRISYAVTENNRGAHYSALESLRAAVHESNFKSAKARYFLARQYQMMSDNGLKSDQGQSFKSSMQTHLREAIKLGNQNLDIYPSNKTYADKSRKILG